MIYLDTAAVVKEPLTDHLVAWLNSHPGPLVASVLVEVELSRALRRAAPQALVGIPAVLGRLFRLEIDATVRAIAAAFPDPLLRSLDAIHLATAQVVQTESGGGLTAFVTYDRRLLAITAAAGLPTAAPGAD